MSMMPGATIGPYRIVEQIGRGGMATVYKAYQPALARYVAIKILPAFFAEDASFRERFQQEAIAIAKLRHPNILLVFDYGEEGGVTYLVSEYVDGGTLSEQLGAPLPLDYTVRILGPIASALDYAHARGILHRDVKPSNILLAHDGTPVLSDFGLAKIVGSLPRLTRTGMTVGTPEYMAPEQGAAEEVGPSADNYALAVVAYEMLTGKVPFSAETPLAILLAHLHKPLPLPRSVNPALPEDAEAVLLKGLAKTPGDRYPTAGEFINALAGAGRTPSSAAREAAVAWPITTGGSGAQVQGTAAAATGAGATEATQAATPASPRRGRVQPRYVVAGGLLALALAGGAVVARQIGGAGSTAASPTSTATQVTAPATGTVALIAGQTTATPRSATGGARSTASATPQQAAASPTKQLVAALPPSATVAAIATRLPSATVVPTATELPSATAAAPATRAAPTSTPGSAPTPVRGPFSTAAGNWLAGGALPRLGWGAVMVRLADGRLLAMGGYDPDSGITRRAAIYDPTHDRWSSAGSMQQGRQVFTATLLKDGRVLVAGGVTRSGATASAELYDPGTGTWKATGPMSTPRMEHVAAMLPDGTVLVAGGEGTKYEPLVSAEIYNPATGSWHSTSGSISDHLSGAAISLPDGSVLVAGGDTRASEVYQPGKGAWEAAGDLSVIRSNFTAMLLRDGRVLAAGGWNPDNNTTWATAELYDPATSRWYPTGSMATPRADQASTLLPDGRVLVSGGLDGKATLASAEVYDPATGRWSTAGSMRQARAAEIAAILDNGTVLVGGGSVDSSLATGYELFQPVARVDAALAQALKPVVRPGSNGPGRRYFPQTGHLLTGPFLRYWDTHLGILVLGLPITEAFQQGDAQVQYCERGLLRLRNGTITLAPLGRELTAHRHFPSQTYTIDPLFAEYYARHQGPILLGAPLWRADRELNGDGTGRRYLVQWFERGRLEYHPETPAHFRVLPGLVGREALRRAEEA